MLDRASERASAAAELVPRGSPAWFEAASAAVGALGQRGENGDVAKWLAEIASVGSSKECRGAHIVALSRAISQLAWAHHGPLDAARARLDLVAEPIDELNPLEAGWVHRVRAEGAWIFDRDVDRCLAAFAAGSEAFERAHALRFLCLLRMNHASLRGWAGDIDGALALVAIARRDAEKMGWGFLANYGLAVTGMIESFGGKPGADESLTRGLERLATSPRLSFICRVLLGWRAIDENDIETAEIHVMAATRGKVTNELKAAAWAVSARIAAHRGDLAKALAEATKASNLAHASRELELFEGLPDAVLAEVHALRGEMSAAREASRQGHERLAAIAATIANRDQRALFWARRIGVDRLVSDARRFGLSVA